MNTVRSHWFRWQWFWCSLMHPDPMWPINGQYRCPKCNRVYSVPWK